MYGGFALLEHSLFVDVWLTLLICEKGALARSLNGASTKPNKKKSLWYLSFKLDQLSYFGVQYYLVSCYSYNVHGIISWIRFAPLSSNTPLFQLGYIYTLVRQSSAIFTSASFLFHGICGRSRNSVISMDVIFATNLYWLFLLHPIFSSDGYIYSVTSIKKSFHSSPKYSCFAGQRTLASTITKFKLPNAPNSLRLSMWLSGNQDWETFIHSRRT